MNIRFVYISPSIDGYQFVPSSDNDARLLELLNPYPSELSSDADFVPIYHAEWLSKSFLRPRYKFIIIIGVRISNAQSILHRGSNSTWAIAAIMNTNTTPTALSIESTARKLGEALMSSIENKEMAQTHFAQSHSELWKIIDSSMLKLIRQDIESLISIGPTFGPFRRRMAI